MDHARSRSGAGTGTARVATGLFLAFFTAQASFIVLAPMLPEVAREFGVSVGTAGQLRTIAAVAGFALALAVIPLSWRLGVRRLLLAGLWLLAGGAAVSAVAPSFAVMAAGQVLIGAGITCVVAAGIAGASDWSPPERRTTVLAWATVGQPAAWVAGLPIVGAVSHLGWRWGWALVPLAAAAAWAVLPRNAVAPPAVRRARGAGRAWRNRHVRRWAFGELMAFAGWGGTLVYAGALLSQSYGLGAETTGLLLGAAAVAYFPGTFAVRRRLEGELGSLLAALALALAAGSLAFGLVRPAAGLSTAIFAALVLLAGARGIAGSAFGLSAAPQEKVAIGGLRSAATQLGYLAGAAAGGIALDSGGYGALGVTLAVFFAAAAMPHLSPGPARRAVGSARRALAPIYAEWSRGNWHAAQPAFAWGFSSEFPGSDGVRLDGSPRSDRLAEWLRDWRHWRVEPERFVPLGCRVVVLTRYRGEGRVSSVAVDEPGAHVWRLRDGAPVELEVFADRETALRAAAAAPCGD